MSAALRIPDAERLAGELAHAESVAETLTNLRAELVRVRKECLDGLDRVAVELERAWRQVRLHRERLTEHQR